MGGMPDIDVKGFIIVIALIGALAGAVVGIGVWELVWWTAEHVQVDWH